MYAGSKILPNTSTTQFLLCLISLSDSHSHPFLSSVYFFDKEQNNHQSFYHGRKRNKREIKSQTSTKYDEMVNDWKGGVYILGRAEWRRDPDSIISRGKAGSLRRKSTRLKTGFTGGAALPRGASAKGCVMKKIEMSAQGLEQRRRTDNVWSRFTSDTEDNRTLRVEGKTPTGSNICRALIQKHCFTVQSTEICCCSIYWGTVD